MQNINLFDRLKSVYMPFALFILTLLISSLFGHIEIDPFHDGMILKPALDMLNGKILFKQTFSQYGMIPVLINLFFLKLLGAKLLSIKFGACAFYSLTSVFLYVSTKKVTSKSIAILTTLVWVGMSYYFTLHFYVWPTIYASCFLVIAIYILLISLREHAKHFSIDSKGVFFAGIFIALSCWCKQTYLFADISLCAFFMVLFVKKQISFRVCAKNIFLLILGFITVSSLLFLYIIPTGGLHDWYLQTIRIGYILGKILSRSFHPFEFLKSLVENPLYLFIHIAALFLLFKQIRLRKLLIKDVNLLLVLCMSIASLLQEYPIYDTAHLYWAATPGFILLGYTFGIFIWYINNPRTNACIKVCMGICILCVGVEIVINCLFGIQRLQMFQDTITYPGVLQGMEVNSMDKDFYEGVQMDINNYLALHKHTRFVTLTQDAIYMAMTKQAQNIGPMYANFSGYTSGVYPYIPNLFIYIREGKPLLLLYEDQYSFPKGYKLLQSWKKGNAVLLEPE